MLALMFCLLVCFEAPNVGKELLPAPKKQPDVSGVYAMHGREGESEYRGSVTIWRAGAGYVVHWSTITEGDGKLSVSQVEGLGLLEGDVLSVSWKGPHGPGVSVYKLSNAGELHGRWLSVPPLPIERTEQLRLLGKVNPLN